MALRTVYNMPSSNIGDNVLCFIKGKTRLKTTLADHFRKQKQVEPDMQEWQFALKLTIPKFQRD